MYVIQDKKKRNLHIKNKENNYYNNDRRKQIFNKNDLNN